MAFRITRQHRYNRLRQVGFERFEARSLSKVPYRRAPYIKQMMRDRVELLEGLRRQGEQLNWSRAKYQREKKAFIYYSYREWGFTVRSRMLGERPDVWQLFRSARDEAIKKGKWKETPRRRRKKYTHININKGNVQAQKERRRERERMKREFDRTRGNRGY